MQNPVQKKFHIANILVIICGLIALVCYDLFGNFGTPVLKGRTSFWFALLGCINLVYAVKNRITGILPVYFISAGLAVGMIADVLLAVDFAKGVIFFAIGHILYLAGFYMIERPHLLDLIISIPVSAISIFVVGGTPFINVPDPVLEKGLMVYAVIISFMAGKSVSNFSMDRTRARLMIAASSVLFLLSDVALMAYMFYSPLRLFWVLCIYVYWPAQLLLAWALLHYAEENKRQRVHINTIRVNYKI